MMLPARAASNLGSVAFVASLLTVCLPATSRAGDCGIVAPKGRTSDLSDVRKKALDMMK
jgi:hypothetical protein